MLLLAAAGPSSMAMSQEPFAATGRPSDTVTVFFTGNELGAMKPCGCASGQLGGLEKRIEIFNAVDRGSRIVLDTGRFVPTEGPQDLIKFNIISQALGILGYDVLVLTPEDLQTAEDLDVIDGLAGSMDVISPEGRGGLPAVFTRIFSTAGGPVAVAVSALGAGSSPERLRKLHADLEEGTVRIVVCGDCDSDFVETVAAENLADCLICPPEADEPVVRDRSAGRLLVVSSGRLGKYVGRIDITFPKSPGKSSGRSAAPRLALSSLPVTAALPADEGIVELYRLYQQLVREAGLLEEYPKSALPGGLEYKGSASCRPCHAYEHDRWSQKAHARAYATLEKIGSQYDPECIACHVVGYEYAGGFVSHTKTPHLKDVGCENCHGPGSEHIESLGKTPTAEPKSACLDCHTPDHSHYMGNERAYMEKIVHWREPEEAGRCQKGWRPRDYDENTAHNQRDGGGPGGGTGGDSGGVRSAR
jgi:hypothetical protein